MSHLKNFNKTFFKERSFIFLFLFSLLFFFLNIYKLSYQSLWMDEGFYILAAKSILKFFYPLYPSGYVLFKSIFYSYLLAIFSFFLGNSVFTYRLLSLIIFSMTPLIIFEIAKDFINTKVLYISSLIFFLFPWETEYARTALYYPLLQLLFTLSVLLFIKSTFFDKKSNFSIFWILSSFTHQLSIGLAFAFPSLLLIKPKIFFKKKNLLSLLFWIPFFTFIMIQEVLFWKVGQVYSTQTVSQQKLEGVIKYFFSHFNLVYFKLLYKSHPFTFPVFFVGSLLFIIYLITKKIKKESVSERNMVFLFLIILLFLILFALGFMRTHPMPRYLFPFHYLYIMIVVFFLFSLLQILKKLGKFILKPSFEITFLFIIAYFSFQQAGFNKVLSIITRDYDEKVTTDIIRTSGRYYPIDHESLGLYVKNNIKKDDIVIAIHMVFQYLYVGKVDYWLFTGGPGTWDAWEKKGNKWREFYLGSEWINSLEKLKRIIKEKMTEGKRIWIITSPSENNPAHINNNIRQFLNKNKDKVLWISRDGIGKVYLFTPFSRKLRKHTYEAEWGIYQNNQLKTINNKIFVKVTKKSLYKTALIFHGENKKRIKINFSPPETDVSVLLEIFKSGVLELKRIIHINKGESSKIIIVKFRNKDRYSLHFRVARGNYILIDSLDYKK